MATVLNASVGGHEGSNAFYNRLNSRFSTCLQESERASIENGLVNEESTLGEYLTQWTSYLEAENAMLHRRTGLFLEVEAATKALSKAKASKAHAARKLKVVYDAIEYRDRKTETSILFESKHRKIRSFDQLFSHHVIFSLFLKYVTKQYFDFFLGR